jgi:hypothetical protein
MGAQKGVEKTLAGDLTTAQLAAFRNIAIGLEVDRRVGHRAAFSRGAGRAC